MSKILRFIFNPWLIRILGFLALGALVWFVGPLFAFADWRPLQSPWVRIAVLLTLVLVYAAIKFWKWYRVRRANARVINSMLKPSADAANQPSAQDAESKELRRRFEEAVGILKKARLSDDSKHAGLTGLASRFTGQYIYELPWYIIIGAPGSGKTTALVNSGLQFPLASHVGAQAVRGVGGTRNCDWWFTDQAVLLDTAGRYTTQESDQSVDASAWGSFLDLLKRNRARRPINGAIVTVSIVELLQQTPIQRESHAEALRKRVQELHEKLGIRFPIYVLITKSDLLAGFSEFFADFAKDERAQVFGFTFPLGAEQATAAEFGTAFGELERNLNARLADRLLQERDPRNRAMIYGFPQQFAVASEALAGFLEKVFSSSSYHEKPQLRGVYFTSGTQEGSPIDRVMGNLARTLGFERQMLPAQQASGRSYFLTRLLNEVIFVEKGLAGVNLKWERRRQFVQWAALGAVALGAIGLVAAWTLSYSGNKAYVGEVADKLPKVKQQVDALSSSVAKDDLLGLLPALRAVHEVSAPIDKRFTGFGLSQRGKLADAEQQAYVRLLHEAFLPRLTYQVEQHLRSVGLDNPELLYEWLKAYLMLNDPEHLDEASLAGLMRIEWENTLPRDVNQPQRQELQAHLDALLARHGKTPLSPDQVLITQVRGNLVRMSLAERVYSRLKREGVGVEIPEFTIAKAAGPSAPLVFQRASGQPLTSGVAGLFTRDGYEKAFLKSYKDVALKLAEEESWVLALPPRAQDQSDATRLEAEVRRLYLQDYAATWERMLADVKLVPITSLRQGIQIAGILSAPDSPLPKLMRAIARETTLGQPVKGEGGAIDKAEQKLNETGDRLRRIMGGKVETSADITLQGRPEAVVDDRFVGIRQQVESDGAGQPAPIEGTVTVLKELYTQLTAAQLSVDGGQPPPQSEVPTKLRAEAARMPEPLRTLMLTLSATSAGQALGSVRTHLSGELNTSVGVFCQQAITGRYPFVRSSARDVTPEDFARMFAPGGLMDQFFQSKLMPYVDISTRPWSFRRIGEASMGTGSGALIEFQRAQVLRDVFFRGNNLPSLRIEFKPLEMDASITQFILDIDGQLVKYSHGPTLPMSIQWPGPRGSNQVRLQVQPSTASGTSGKVFEGPWALFRMFDRLSIEPAGQPERFNITFDVDGRKARFEVRASSVQNPFRLPELDQFHCPSEL